MAKPSSPRRRGPTPPKREWLNAPTALILLAGAVVFAAFQVSFELAIVAGLAVGAIVWIGWRRRDGGRNRAKSASKRR